MAVAHLDLASDPQASTRRWLSRPDFVLYFLWGMFWLLMLTVAVQDYIRDGGKQLWQPILWEGTSLAMATLWVVLQRRVDKRYAVYLDRPLTWLWHHVKWLPLVILRLLGWLLRRLKCLQALLGAPDGLAFRLDL